MKEWREILTWTHYISLNNNILKKIFSPQISPTTFFQVQDELYQWLQCHTIKNITRDKYTNQVTPPGSTKNTLVSQD